MQVGKVMVLRSPYYNVKRGAVGKLVAIKFEGTRNEVWRVKFDNGESRLFRPGEVKALS